MCIAHFEISFKLSDAGHCICVCALEVKNNFIYKTFPTVTKNPQTTFAFGNKTVFLVTTLSVSVLLEPQR